MYGSSQKRHLYSSCTARSLDFPFSFPFLTLSLSPFAGFLVMVDLPQAVEVLAMGILVSEFCSWTSGKVEKLTIGTRDEMAHPEKSSMEMLFPGVTSTFERLLFCGGCPSTSLTPRISFKTSSTASDIGPASTGESFFSCGSLLRTC